MTTPKHRFMHAPDDPDACKQLAEAVGADAGALLSEMLAAYTHDEQIILLQALEDALAREAPGPDALREAQAQAVDQALEAWCRGELEGLPVLDAAARAEVRRLTGGWALRSFRCEHPRRTGQTELSAALTLQGRAWRLEVDKWYHREHYDFDLMYQEDAGWRSVRDPAVLPGVLGTTLSAEQSLALLFLLTADRVVGPGKMDLPWFESELEG